MGLDSKDRLLNPSASQINNLKILFSDAGYKNAWNEAFGIKNKTGSILVDKMKGLNKMEVIDKIKNKQISFPISNLDLYYVSKALNISIFIVHRKENEKEKEKEKEKESEEEHRGDDNDRALSSTFIKSETSPYVLMLFASKEASKNKNNDGKDEDKDKKNKENTTYSIIVNKKQPRLLYDYRLLDPNVQALFRLHTDNKDYIQNKVNKLFV